MRLHGTIAVIVNTMLLSSNFAFALDETESRQEALRFFESRIRPLLVKRCFKCHANSQHKGGLRLDSRESLLQGGDNGPAFKPGDPDNSLLIRAINYRDLEMPPDGKLKAEEIQALRIWDLHTP